MAGPSATVLVADEELEAPILPRLPGGPLVVGDHVELRREGGGAVITAVLPRRTKLERVTGQPGRTRPRVVVANADLLVVVASLTDPPLRPWLVDRYLVAAHVGGLSAALLLTKSDLAHDPVVADELVATYRSLGHEVICGSLHDSSTVAAVRALIGDRVAALAGESGVGKSTLTRALTGVDRAVGHVSERSRTGRHTTSDPRLIPLAGGGAIIDTAGVRSFYLPAMSADDLAGAFPEIAARVAECRFSDCRHAGEDGCAVAGHASPARLDSYRRILAAVAPAPGATA